MKNPCLRPSRTLKINDCLCSLTLGLASLAMIIALNAASIPSAAASASAAGTCPSLLNQSFPKLQDDSAQSLCQYAGKVVLVVNTASYCGFTSQYDGLEKLYSQHKDQGLVVLGFPSNDFSQEPGTNQEIAAFCGNTFAVKFPMFAKTTVKGPKANPLFAELSRLAEPPGWNFHKYLIGRDGRLVGSYSSMVGPQSRSLRRDLDKALAAPAAIK
jgi:glutathione peroxidase